MVLPEHLKLNRKYDAKDLVSREIMDIARKHYAKLKRRKKRAKRRLT